MTRYFMKFTPLFAAEVQMMTPPRHQPRRSGRIRSSFRYSADDVRCKDCTRYDSGHPCHLNECVCLEERIEAGVVELNALARECFGGRMFRPLQRRLRDELNRQSFRFFLSDSHRARQQRLRLPRHPPLRYSPGTVQHLSGGEDHFRWR